MAITDINISEELTTNAPSIKYRGNEGPKAPMQMAAADPMLVEEYQKYVFEMEEQGLQPVSFEQFVQEIMSGMANGGRAGYGLGSIVKSITRPIKKVVSKVGDVASSDLGKAALIGGTMFGLPGTQFGGLLGRASFGGAAPSIFGKTGGIKALLSQYFKPSTYLSKNIDGTIEHTIPSRFSEMISNYPGGKIGLGLTAASLLPIAGIGMQEDEVLEDFPVTDKVSQAFDIDYSKMRQEIADAAARGASLDEIKAIQIKYGVTPSTLGSSWDTIKKAAEGGRINRYEGGLSVPSQYTIEDAIKTSMQDKMGGITDVMKQADLYRQGDVGQMYMNQGGRIGYRYGRTYKDATEREKLKEILKNRDIISLDDYSTEELMSLLKGMRPSRKQGRFGRLRKQEGGGADYINTHKPKKRGNPPVMSQKKQKKDEDEKSEFLKKLIKFRDSVLDVPETMSPLPDNRKMKNEGGLLDLGGMEKDYRETGGFVPIGEYEKKDDVPARLSVNEFVMTADAVRGAGDGDIDKGSEVMEGIMENFEQKGRAMKGNMTPMKSEMEPLRSRMNPMESGVGEVISGALEATGGAPSANVPMQELEALSEGMRNIPSDRMKMAGPDWYLKRIEHLMFLGYSYEEAADIAYDSNKYYEVIGSDPMARKQGASDMFEVSERLSEVV